MTNSIIGNTFLRVEFDGKPVWLAFLDAEDRFWSYLPNTGQFHHNPGLYEDYFFDQDFTYEPISSGAARRMIEERVGERPSDDDATMRALADEPTRTPDSLLRPRYQGR